MLPGADYVSMIAACLFKQKKNKNNHNNIKLFGTTAGWFKYLCMHLVSFKCCRPQSCTIYFEWGKVLSLSPSHCNGDLEHGKKQNKYGIFICRTKLWFLSQILSKILYLCLQSSKWSPKTHTWSQEKEKLTPWNGWAYRFRNHKA